MIDRLHMHKAIDELEVGTLHRLRKFGSRASHEDETVNTATSAILSNINALRELQSKYLDSLYSTALRLVAVGSGPPADQHREHGKIKSDNAILRFACSKRPRLFETLGELRRSSPRCW